MEYFRQYEFLSKESCADMVSAIFHLKSHWYRRVLPSLNGPSEMYNLGIPAVTKSVLKTDYSDKYSRLNGVLLDHFFDFYCLYLMRAEEVLGAPIVFAEDSSLPGFNILMDDGFRSLVVNRWHTDSDYLFVPSLKNTTPKSFVSITVPLYLPAHGGGVDYYENSGSQRNRVKSLIYKIGTMNLINSNTPHRFKPPPPMTKDGDWRITFQSFGVFNGSQWTLFW